MSEHYILDGHKVVQANLETWARWTENADRHVAKDTVAGRWVSTVFLGLDHQYGKGPPLLFETMVFPSKDDLSEIYCDRYSTWEEAEAGHAKAIAWVKDGEK